MMNQHRRCSLLGAGLIFVTLLAPNQSAAGEAPVQGSARDFCRSGGGTVTETALPHVYVCHYAQRERCVRSDTARGLSRVVDCRTGLGASGGYTVVKGND